MNRFARLVALALLLLPPAPAPAQTGAEGPVAERILGTWKLVSYVGEDVASGNRTDVMGAVATPQEAQALLTSLLAYAGTYTLDTAAHTVTHHIEVSWDQTRTGESHVRTYRFEATV
jgi:lipocalin-like protein